MAKIYSYEVFKIKREIQSLELELHEMLASSNSYVFWMDKYRMDQVKKRIVELKIKLNAIMIDEK